VSSKLPPLKDGFSRRLNITITDSRVCTTCGGKGHMPDSEWKDEYDTWHSTPCKAACMFGQNIVHRRGTLRENKNGTFSLVTERRKERK